MAWIKRNLFLVVGGVIALLALGAAGFYIYKGWDRNSTALTSLTEVVGTLKAATEQKPVPGSGKVDNIAIAREQNKQVQAWIASATGYFQPIPAIPSGAITSEAFAGALRRTLDQLQKEAESAGVVLPPKYDFSFSAQRPLVKFAPGTELLAAQLGEVKAMADILFTARVNALDSIQRVRVTDDDTQGPQSDYIEQRPVTNELAVITPYVVTFRSFTPELSRVMAGFATASNTFIVKSVNVQPAGAASALGMLPGGNPEMAPGMAPGGVPPGGVPLMRLPAEGGYGAYAQSAAAQAAAAAAAAAKGGSQTVLKEQLLRVTVEVGLVKLLPKN
jgi:hypothetical protein